MRWKGYKYRRSKTRFGVLSSAKKVRARNLTSAIIGALVVSRKCLYFNDESTFSLNDFRGISDSRLKAFQISRSAHKEEDVADFVLRVMIEESTKNNDNHRRYLVLDNSPKKRNKGFIEEVEKGPFGLIFITPGTPEQNLCENFFLLVKHQVRTLDSLSRINQASGPFFELIKVILEARDVVIKDKFTHIRNAFIHELTTSLHF